MGHRRAAGFEEFLKWLEIIPLSWIHDLNNHEMGFIEDLIRPLRTFDSAFTQLDIISLYFGFYDDILDSWQIAEKYNLHSKRVISGYLGKVGNEFKGDDYKKMLNFLFNPEHRADGINIAATEQMSLFQMRKRAKLEAEMIKIKQDLEITKDLAIKYKSLLKT